MVSAGPAPIPLRLGEVSYVFTCSGKGNLHASAHETIIAVCLGSPDTAAEADQCGGDHDWSPAKACLQRHPDEVTESKHKDSNSSELNDVRQG